ncbi:hypothetical protein RSJ22_00380 (plasmid) [Clostridium botulinum]|uniref:hypothetical protein n=1 Tax=Clostridium botulinum TaxID=1491 RepID=UPI000C7744F8|nr:hypothetical protein [Clostridium botulinum]AUN19988.1 hypothetical protein RSJ22_00380 [Clostridium botulinum]
MDIKEIAKEMTREEFLNSEYIKEIDKEGYFIEYKCVDDEFRTKKHECDCENNVPFSCERCWNNAVKDIKFKEKNNMGINKKIETMNSLEDLKEISKEITREEFLKKAINYNRYCPGQINLKDCSNSDDYSCSTTPCYSCWENAIKDIKFKGETCMEFNWDEFKKGEIVIHCDTKEKAINFLGECNLQNIKWADKEYIIPTKCYFGQYESDTCYRFLNSDFICGLTYKSLKFYKSLDLNIIEWEIEKGENMLNDLTTKKLDYDREYDILEIKEFPEETEFISEGKYISKLKDGFLKARYVDDISNSWTKCFLTKEWLNAKFKLVKKDRKVSFEEAMQAFRKEIYCTLDDGKTKVNYYIESKQSLLLDTNNILAITPEEILNGEWYIKED